MKRFTSLLFTGLVSLIFLAGCGDSDNKELTLNSKHKELPDYVLGTSDLIKETYIMAAEYPKVLASVPCYCGCYGEDGHISNLDCFVDQMGSNNEVIEWDAMSVSWDLCIDIAREAVELHQGGQSLREINEHITTKYADFGEPTPTPKPE